MLRHTGGCVVVLLLSASAFVYEKTGPGQWRIKSRTTMQPLTDAPLKIAQ
jgi:hypothetical protein